MSSAAAALGEKHEPENKGIGRALVHSCGFGWFSLLTITNTNIHFSTTPLCTEFSFILVASAFIKGSVVYRVGHMADPFHNASFIAVLAVLSLGQCTKLATVHFARSVGCRSVRLWRKHIASVLDEAATFACGTSEAVGLWTPHSTTLLTFRWGPPFIIESCLVASSIYEAASPAITTGIAWAPLARFLDTLSRKLHMTIVPNHASTFTLFAGVIFRAVRNLRWRLR